MGKGIKVVCTDGVRMEIFNLTCRYFQNTSYDLVTRSTFSMNKRHFGCLIQFSNLVLSIFPLLPGLDYFSCIEFHEFLSNWN